MSPLVDSTRLEIKLGDFRSGSALALGDPVILPRVQEYRRISGNRMAPLDHRELRKRFSRGEYYVSKKIDGEFNVLVFDSSEALLVNPGGTVRTGLPLLLEASRLLAASGVKKALIAGELHFERPDGKRPRVHDVSRVARQPGSADELARLNFAVFDILEWNGASPSPAFRDVWDLISTVFGRGTLVRPVETVPAKTVDEIEELFGTWVEEGENEGLVIRSDTAGIFKVKPVFTVDAAVVGYSEGTDDRTGMIHDLLVALMRPDGTFQVFARVGGGYSDDERRNFLSDLKDLAAESDYAEINPDHLAYQMVRPEWVIEVKCLDFITQTSRLGTIDRMVLDWDGAASRWKIVRRLPFVSAISPNFVRKRDDKRPRQEDIPVRQVADLVEVAGLDRDARSLVLKKSEVLRREVYTKVQKGQTMVRKFLLFKTNKKEEGTHPGFVVYYTDFSPNRKTPLEREIRVTDLLEQAVSLFDAFVKENVLKGWGRVG